MCLNKGEGEGELSQILLNNSALFIALRLQETYSIETEVPKEAVVLFFEGGVGGVWDISSHPGTQSFIIYLLSII